MGPRLCNVVQRCATNPRNAAQLAHRPANAHRALPLTNVTRPTLLSPASWWTRVLGWEVATRGWAASLLYNRGSQPPEAALQVRRRFR